MVRALAATAVLVSVTASASGFEPGRAGMTLEVRGYAIPYREFAIFVKPADPLRVALREAELRPGARWSADWGGFVAQAPGVWSGTAPAASGVYDATLESGERRLLLHVFVMVPFSAVEGAALNGYRMGEYPREPLRGLPAYRPPPGFVEVTPANQGIRVSPHFTLGQFLCKQKGGFPKYVALQERLLLKLEHLLELVNASGHPAETFFVMSGFRTPAYNAAIGNVRYSRHQWGDAADVFIDERPRDGVMDDLDGDGRVDLRDAILLYDLFDRSAARPRRGTELPGGLGLYGTTAAHGPFVHVDTRGYRARWGR
jgi:hypothetical protein